MILGFIGDMWVGGTTSGLSIWTRASTPMSYLLVRYHHHYNMTISYKTYIPVPAVAGFKPSNFESVVYYSTKIV
jgi:hypothetical protein